MSSAGWSDLVTTALLGTARRPVPEGLPPSWTVSADADPAARVLSLAAGYQVAARAGRVPVRPGLSRPPALEPPPAEALPPAPDRARQVLAELLVQPHPALVNLWLADCAGRGFGLAREHWTPIAAHAARSTAYDRPLLGRALGAQGQWFLRQNAQWRRLAEAAATDPTSRPASGAEPIVIPETVTRDPEVIFAGRQPWPDDVVAAGLRVVAEGRLGTAGRAYASRLGAEMPLQAYPLIIRAAEHALWERPVPLAERRLARECLVGCEQAAWMRIEIRSAFEDPEPPTGRLDVPPLSTGGSP